MNADTEDISTYQCFACGSFHATRDIYVDHLIAKHPETWLAQRSIREQVGREKLKHGTSK